MPITKEQALALAREVGTPYVNKHYPGQTSIGFTEESLLTFAQAAYKLGRNEGLEAAISAVLHAGPKEYPALLITEGFSKAIESLKDNTP